MEVKVKRIIFEEVMAIQYRGRARVYREMGYPDIAAERERMAAEWDKSAKMWRDTLAKRKGGK